MSDEKPVSDRSNVKRHLVSFVCGCGVSSLGICFVLNAVHFASYLRLSLLVLVGGALALHHRGRMLLRFGVISLAASSFIIAFTPLMDRSVRALDVSVSPHSADVIVILGAGLHCGSGELDAASIARLTKGLALWKAGFAPMITISDADPSMVGKNCPSQGKVTTDFIESLYGTNGPPIVVLPRMRTTRTEAREVAQQQRSQGWKSVMVVTSPTHSRRALRTFRESGVDAFVVAASEPQFDTRFHHPVDRVRAVGSVVREVAGMIKYRLTS